MTRERVRRPPWPAVVVFALLGAALAAQINLQRQIESAPRVDEARIEQVLSLYIDQKTENKRLQERLAELTANLEAERRRGAVTRGYEEVRNELDQVRRFAGLTPLQGPGIRVLLKDAAVPSAVEIDQSAYTVHDQDLLLVINELWAAQAEAIAVNGQRLSVTSEVRCSGPVIDINKRSIGSPYEITAIGDPETLRSALENLRGGIVDQLRNAGIEVKTTKEKNVVVPALSSEPSFRYALPARIDTSPHSADGG